MQHNNSNPLVSVLTTCYNREKYIGEAIQSIINSTYSNWELIITDDGSKDNSVEIAKEYALKDSRIRVYINETNLGDYFNRNKAASYAKGKYLKYLDADDYIYPWGLQLLVEIMESFPEAGLGLCSLHQDKHMPFPFMLSPKEAYEYNYFGPGLFHKAPLSSIIKRDSFEAVKGFTGKQHMGDFELWHRLTLKYPVVLMPHGMVWYREHDDQQMNANRTDPSINFKYKVGALKFFKKELKVPLSTNQILIIKKKLTRSMNQIILRKILKGNFRIAKLLYNMKSSESYTLNSVD